VTALRITGGPHASASIEINGTDVSRAVRGLTLTMKVGRLPTVVLEVPVLQGLSAEAGEVDVRIPDETRELLLKLGWTAPEEP